MSKVKDLTGETFGRLHVIERATNNERGQARWICECECGTKKIVCGYNLRRGDTVSCGCLRRERMEQNASRMNLKHGESKSRLYRVWRGMLQRIDDPNRPKYKHYGGRGISVCESWRDYLTFRKWAFEAGYDENAAYGECTLDRIDVNGNYSPDNCRWVSISDQNKNRRICGGTDDE